MGLPMLTLDARTTRVCSVDSSVKLKFSELTEEDKKAGKAPVREPRRPIRWLKVEDVAEVGADALRVTYRPLNDDEQMDVSGGLPALSRERLGVASLKALHIGVTKITGTDAEGRRIDAHTPAEVARELQRWHAVHSHSLGEEILGDSMGFNLPLPSSE